MKLSYQQIREMFESTTPQAWLVDLTDDVITYDKEGKYYQCGYTLMDGKLQLGSAVEVKRTVEYIKASGRQDGVHLVAAVGDPTSDDYGYEWDISFMRYGLGVDGRINWPKEKIVAAFPAFEGAKVFALSISQHLPDSGQYGKSARDIVGWISDPIDKGAYAGARFHILKSAKWLRDGVIDSFQRGKPDLYGFSIHAIGAKAVGKMLAGKKVLEPDTIPKVEVDVVHDPTNDGKFLQMVAAVEPGHKEEAMLKQLFAALKTLRPDLKAAIEAIEAKGDAATAEEVSGLMASVMAAPEGLDAQIKAAVTALGEELKASLKPAKEPDAGDPAAEALKTMQLTASRMVLRDELKASELPEAVQKKLAKQYEGRIFDEAELKASIKAEKEVMDSLTASGIIVGAGRVAVVQSDMESRVKMLSDFFKGANGQHSIRRAYVHITGDEMVTGRIQDASRLKASINTTTFDQIFGDAVHKQMIEDYSAIGMDDWRKVVKVVPLSDFKTVHRIRKGGYGNLPVVLEGADYLSLATPTDEEQSYAPTKKGGTEDLTLEAIKNDDAGGVRDIPMSLAVSAKTTLYEFVFVDLFSANPTMGYDSTALFHADHGNLGSAALDATALGARRRAMAKQTRLFNGKRLNVRAKYILVPIDLDKTAFDLVAVPGDFTPTSADFTRTFQIEPLVISCWTDATDWALAADPRFCPTIEIGFVDGNEEPQLFVQDMPNVGSLFNADKITYKIKHPYGGVNLDHRGVDMSVVAN